jgi:hypothetical protein
MLVDKSQLLHDTVRLLKSIVQFLFYSLKIYNFQAALKGFRNIEGSSCSFCFRIPLLISSAREYAPGFSDGFSGLPEFILSLYIINHYPERGQRKEARNRASFAG